MNINISTGEIRLTVNDDPNRIIAFNPNDLGFVEAFYGIVATLEAKEREYNIRLMELDRDNGVDDYGIPRNAKERIQLLKDLCSDIRAEIDAVFGDGTSKAAFGNTNTLNMFEQFFDGIKPFFQQTREEKMAKYKPVNREQRRAMK